MRNGGKAGNEPGHKSLLRLHTDICTLPSHFIGRCCATQQQWEITQSEITLSSDTQLKSQS